MTETRKSVEQAALEFAEKRGDSKNLEMRAEAGKILLHELGTLIARGMVAFVTDQGDNCTYYSLTDMGLRRLRKLRDAEVTQQLTPAGQNQLDLILEQMVRLNEQVIVMNNELVNIREGIYHGKEAIPTPVNTKSPTGQATEARAYKGRGEDGASGRAADAGE